jgi:N-methylhydantoinase A
MNSLKYRLGVDIGGTFTDITVVSDDGVVFSKKLLSTPIDYSEAIGVGVKALIDDIGIDPDDITEFVHATTVATNAIIERRGVRVALVTTRGFRDVLELGRFRAPRPYDINFRKPDPLVERRLRFEIDERIAADGSIVNSLNPDSLESLAQVLGREQIDAVAICLINSYTNPAHEIEAAEFLRRRFPALSVSTSSSLLPQMGEYERTSTTVVNAYIRPVVERYLTSLGGRLHGLGIKAPLMIMQSSGGLSPGGVVADRPITIIESGPAAGVLGGHRLGDHVGISNMIVFDMGGTTAKATIIEDLEFSISPETEVGGAASLGSRMIKGAGYPVQVPTIDIAEVGAGGGSIAFVDTAGGFKVGPRSAGADPGPVCYGKGGVDPTVTDANLVLGYLNPDELVGGELTLDKERAAEAVRKLSDRVGLDPVATAYGIHQLANATMLRALHGVSSERGQDPARFAMFAIGGNGPVHASSLAESGNMRHIVVPPVAGLFSALGMLFADVEHQLVKGYYRRVDEVSPETINNAFSDLYEEGRELLAQQGFADVRQQAIEAFVEVKYLSQTSPITVKLFEVPANTRTFDQLAKDFERIHLKTFGYATGEALQLVALKVSCKGISDSPRMPSRMQRHKERIVQQRDRKAYFGPENGWVSAPVLARSDISREPMQGPLIVEEYDTTVVVRPDWRVWTDEWNNIHMQR